MLGHASGAMTLDVYADLFDTDFEAVGIALDQAANFPADGTFLRTDCGREGDRRPFNRAFCLISADKARVGPEGLEAFFGR